MIEESGFVFDNVKTFLAESQLFKDLSPSTISHMAEKMSLYRFDEGEYLIEKNKPGRNLLVISQGKVCVPLGDDKIYLTQGAVVGEMSLLSGQSAKADVIADTTTKAFALNRYDFQNLMSKHEDLAATIKALAESRS